MVWRGLFSGPLPGSCPFSGIHGTFSTNHTYAPHTMGCAAPNFGGLTRRTGFQHQPKISGKLGPSKPGNVRKAFRETPQSGKELPAVGEKTNRIPLILRSFCRAPKNFFASGVYPGRAKILLSCYLVSLSPLSWKLMRG